ncbi:vesicle transport through interaction with t-SNAREs homolog 1B-like [Ptychodera flava]|uniref:vesicle transport through interaction with t-SNAREs homolog 1B-like n=1 Tax=Ptychodera flava TaxID=63121 RepID=UPI00396A1D29
MSSEQFENHEEEFNDLYADLKSKIHERIPTCSGEERKRLIRECERGFENGHILLQEMEEELKPAPGSFRVSLLGRIRNYRKDLEKLQRDLRHMPSGAGGRDALLSTGIYDSGRDIAAIQASQRARLLQGTETLNRASDSIERSHRISAETDAIGVEIIDELGEQKEQLVRTRDRVQGMDQDLSRSRRILNSMGRRVITNKLLLGFIILLELAILGAVLYLKLR